MYEIRDQRPKKKVRSGITVTVATFTVTFPKTYAKGTKLGGSVKNNLREAEGVRK